MIQLEKSKRAAIPTTVVTIAHSNNRKWRWLKVNPKTKLIVKVMIWVDVTYERDMHICKQACILNTNKKRNFNNTHVNGYGTLYDELLCHLTDSVCFECHYSASFYDYLMVSGITTATYSLSTYYHHLSGIE